MNGKFPGTVVCVYIIHEEVDASCWDPVADAYENATILEDSPNLGEVRTGLIKA